MSYYNGTHALSFPIEANAKKKQRGESEEFNRKYVSEACIECKKKHTKCDGNNPCSRCVNKQLTCTFPVNSEKKRRGPTPGRVQRISNPH